MSGVDKRQTSNVEPSPSPLTLGGQSRDERVEKWAITANVTRREPSTQFTYYPLMAKLQQQQQSARMKEANNNKSGNNVTKSTECAPEWVSVKKRVGQSIKAATGRGARRQQIGRFIKRVSGWQIMSLTIRWAVHSQSAVNSQQSTVTQGHWHWAESMAMPKHVTSQHAEGVAEYTKCVSPERQVYP